MERHAQHNDAGAPAATERVGVLTLGDGNFSYSLALQKKQLQKIALTATSFDTLDELRRKYPETERICAQLRELNAHVLHGIDATNVRVSLSNCIASINESTEVGGAKALQVFDRVVFNHPHCGEENVKRHRSLLSHFFASAQDVLAVDGELHVTLAADQPENWQAVERAAWACLRLVRRVEDVDADPEWGVEYERKRHQNGRSFHRITLHGEKKQQASTLFIFARQTEKGTIDAAAASTAAGDADSVTDNTTDKPTKKRKTKDDSNTTGTATNAFGCTQCDRTFKTQQGVKTHVHMVHKLGVAGAATAVTVALPCAHCDRVFQAEDARQQHQIAKHGKDQLIQPDWFSKQQETAIARDTAEPSKAFRCEICRLEYPTQDDLQQHWQALQPNAVFSKKCDRCQRQFDEERALRQHMNYCAAKNEDNK
ncbi:TPA: hypothetical protein N0F65_007644 [Lagenidium giganteum]|uniref:C2H2-type domain-containing protein n=1 Tax=Lagenidium giganteum TaxID=4803 RepID=A0AAV2ZA41_9STRA|nr:TPA: hypothetical protein N0F65_007644 [Lagenidium giganteum]